MNGRERVYLEDPESFVLRNGDGVVLISAPHCVQQLRNGRIKPAEPETGILVRRLHEELNCPIIYKTRNCGDDANYDIDSPYKKAIVDYVVSHGIKFLIDLHQLSQKKNIGVDIGIAKGRHIDGFETLNILLFEFSSHNLGAIQIDKPFAALQPYTIASYIREKTRIQTVQLEINSRFLHGDLAGLYFEKTYCALKNSIIKINNYLGE